MIGGFTPTQSYPLSEVLHPLVATYFATHFTTANAEQKRRVSRCLQTLQASATDIVSVLVDACFLRQGQNNETTSPKTLKGTTGTLDGTPGWTGDGILLDGSTQRGYWTVTTVTAHTLVLDVFGADSGQTSDAFIGGVINTAGLTTCASGIGLTGTGAAQCYTRQGGTVTLSDAVGDSGQAFCVHYYNPLPQVIIFTNDNAASPAMTAYVDGFPSMSDSTALTQCTSALNKVIVGARNTSGGSWDIPFKGGCAGWMLFSRVLTAAEAITVTAAMRCLDDRPINLVTYGDSMTCQLSDVTRVVGSWPAKLIRTTAWIGHARLCNAANNGTTAATGASTYTARCSQYAPDGVNVREGFFYCLYGANDLLASTSAANILISLKAIWAAARADGFRVIAMTLPISNTDGGGAGYTAAQEAVRLTLNTSIIAATNFWDGVIDLDALCAYHTDLYVDNLHPNPNGNKSIAAFVVRGGRDLYVDNWPQITPGGTTGAQTINRINGSVNFAATTTTLVVTNNLVTAKSQIYPVIATASATAVIKSAVAAAGSFTLTIAADAALEIRVNFSVKP